MNNPSPFFSVVIPTYNRADLIGRTVDSVLAQTFRDFEILVVDNKSDDRTAEVLRPYIEERLIQFVQNERNFERAFSRNRGIAMARGRYVTLLDSDDILYADCLKDAFDYVRQNPQTGFFHCLYEMVDSQYRTCRKCVFPPITDPFRQLMEGNFISNIGVFYRRDIVEKVRFDEDPRLIGVEDYDFVIRVLAEVRHVGRIEKVNCGVLQHPGRSVLLEEYEKAHARVGYFLDKCLQSARFMQVYGQYEVIFRSHQLLYLCSTAAVRGKTSRAIGLWCRAIATRVQTMATAKAWIHLLVIIKYLLR